MVELPKRSRAAITLVVGCLHKLRATHPLAAIAAAADCIWRSPWLDGLLWTAAVAVCTFFVWRPQAPGVAAVALGGLAAIVTFREMKATQKLLGILLILALIWLEFRSIRRDRNEQRQEHIADQRTLLKNFQDILSANQISISKTEANFESVLRHLDNVTEDVTGGNSFAFVVPQDRDAAEWCRGIPRVCTPAIPLTVSNGGNHPLRNVSITIVDLAHYPKDALDAFYGSVPITIGVIPPHGLQEIKGPPLVPDIQADGVAKYWIFLRAQNGLVTQFLRIRKGRNGYSWGHAYVVTKQVANPVNPNTFGIKTILSVGWTDVPKSPPANPPTAPPPSPAPQASLERK